MKKIVALVLALVLTFAFALTAFAAVSPTPDDNANKGEGDGTSPPTGSNLALFAALAFMSMPVAYVAKKRLT